MMIDVALSLLKEITAHSYKAYIVGGFVRDYILNIESKDIDITTNATPKQLKEIFEDSCVPNEDYGSVIVNLKGIRFEITTFRTEIEYDNYRRPVEIKYIDDLYSDLLRRDFTINTICIDEDGQIIDYLDGREDIENKIIRSVGSSYDKFLEDSLRILRAIRFATILDFQLSDDVISGIMETKHGLKKLSYFRKKSELDIIFTSSNRKKGIKLLLDLGLDKVLEIPKLSSVIDVETSSSIGIWSMLDVTSKYPFNKNEIELIQDINRVIKLNNLDPMALYKYGLYVNSVAAEIKGLDIKRVAQAYGALTIKSREEIVVDSEKIMDILKKRPGKYLKDIYEDIEREILYRRLKNEEKEICDYILKNYGMGGLL